ncbi:MAG: hypothetical protein RL331_59 [Bacteroidota bacterium]|jgi:hypothetical protein
MKLKFTRRKNLISSALIVFLSLPAISHSQLGSIMYGLHRQMNPSTVSLVEIDPSTGVMTPVGNQVLSTTVNSTGVSLNPYELSYSYQDDNSWLTLSVLDGSVISDVTVNLPSATGDFNNFRFNTADSIMYGLYSQVSYDPNTGQYSGDMRLASCDLSTGLVSLISPSSVATSYTMAGAVINPHLMVYYFISEGKLRGLDIYNGSIFSNPTITIPSGGDSFDNFAYNCGDTTMYGLIMQNGVKCLGKIDAATGIVTPLPTLLNLPNYIMNAATIDPITGVYYFETMSNTGVVLMGLSLIDGSIVSQIEISNGSYFDMFRIENDCFEAFPTRVNPAANLNSQQQTALEFGPNPFSTHVEVNISEKPTAVRLHNALGQAFPISWNFTNELHLDFPQLEKGFYWLTLELTEGPQTILLQKD